ncbi:NmrA-like family-domain-containing protein [Mycena rebaudengoi]|nr:NmrA-like family-domain-containing protein [Mycena rebaudengoi]
MPVITIFGATGTQGSSVLTAVLADGKFTPRAVTRNPDSDSSKALKAKGVQVVKANLFDKESVKEALKGSDIVFGVTNFWDPEVFPADHAGKGEIEQGKNLVDAAKEVGIKFFIWSTLPNATKISNGKYSQVYHVDNKAIVEDYLKESGVPNASIGPGWFAENLWKIGALKKTAEGYIIPVPRFTAESFQVITWVSRDLGEAVLALAKNYSDPSKGVGENLSTIGAKVSFAPIETAGLAEIDDMYSFQAEYDMYPELTVPNQDLLALGAKLGTLEEFIRTEVVPRFT